MSNVYHNQKTIKTQRASGAITQVDQLRSALIAKRDTIQSGNVEEIQLINRALDALAQQDRKSKNPAQTQAVTESQAEVAQARQAINPVSSLINENNAKKIRSIRGVPGMALPPGAKFASMNEREPSYVSYIKTNIDGLFALASKNA